jgi:hypothetical protein
MATLTAHLTVQVECYMQRIQQWLLPHKSAASKLCSGPTRGRPDYPGTVFGVAASDTGTPMSDVARFRTQLLTTKDR